MRRFFPVRFALTALAALLALASCSRYEGISAEDLAGVPTVYAAVKKEPDPLLMGHWRRPAPSGLSKPWAFSYCLVKRGDRYAVFYFYDSHLKNSFKGWADFTIDGNRMTSGVDGTTFSVEGGQVIMRYPGRTDRYRMTRTD
jgi:hypothetical protein